LSGQFLLGVSIYTIALLTKLAPFKLDGFFDNSGT